MSFSNFTIKKLTPQKGAGLYPFKPATFQVEVKLNVLSP